MAKEKDDKYQGEERRSEPRSVADRYFSVEFSIKNLDHVYQFQIREISSSGLCVLVKEGSAVLDHLQVGDVLNLKYNPSNLTKPPENCRHSRVLPMKSFRGLSFCAAVL